MTMASTKNPWRGFVGSCVRHVDLERRPSPDIRCSRSSSVDPKSQHWRHGHSDVSSEGQVGATRRRGSGGGVLQTDTRAEKLPSFLARPRSPQFHSHIGTSRRATLSEKNVRGKRLPSSH